MMPNGTPADVHDASRINIEIGKLKKEYKKPALTKERMVTMDKELNDL
jgi:hypothetical protein